MKINFNEFDLKLVNKISNDLDWLREWCRAGVKFQKKDFYIYKKENGEYFGSNYKLTIPLTRKIIKPNEIFIPQSYRQIK